MGIVLYAWLPGKFCIYRPSKWWMHGGPIIECERIATAFRWHAPGWRAEKPFAGATTQFGETLLIAAMRAYVASVYGKEVPEIAQ